MSMSTHVVGFRPPDDRWQQMKAVWDAAKVAGIPVPDAVEDFFEGEPPDPAGVTVELRNTSALREWKNDYAQGFELDVRQLPPEVHVVRFYNSW
jgi:hypothetical protein